MAQWIEQIRPVGRSQSEEKPINVVIVDDSKLIRRAVRGLLTSEPDIKVVGEAENGAQALDLVARLKPDVITLDVNMPVMDGISTIKHLMIKSPLPVVMLSTLTEEGANVTFDALRYGATDFMLKPSRLASHDAGEQHREIIRRVKNASRVDTGSIRFVRIAGGKGRRNRPRHAECLFAVGLGASEGGYGPLLNIVPSLDPDKPVAYIAVLYTGGHYLKAFAKYLSAHSGVDVVCAQDGMPLNAGTCYLLTGNEYATLSCNNGPPAFCIHPTPFPHRRGTLNMLMFSLGEVFKQNSAGVVLSGMSEDGSEGLREIDRHGGRTIVQDPCTCLHKQMPLSAIRSCEAAGVISDLKIAHELNTIFHQ